MTLGFLILLAVLFPAQARALLTMMMLGTALLAATLALS